MNFFLRGKNYIVLNLALYYYKNFLEVEFFFNQEPTIIIGVHRLLVTESGNFVRKITWIFSIIDGGCNIIFGFLAIVFISSTFVTGKQIGGRRRIAG